LVTERICGRDLGVLLDEGAAMAEGSGILAGAADFVAQLMRAGVVHPSLHPGNVLVGGEQGAPTFSLFDLRGIRLDSGLGVTEKRRLLVVLVPLLEELSDAERNEALARAVSGDPDASALTSWPALVHAWGQLCRDRWRGLRRGLLRDGDHCLEVADSTGRWLIVDSPDGVRDALSFYLDRDSDRVTLLKDDRKRRVARVRADSASYIVKEYRTARWRWLWRPDRLGWLNTARARSVSLRVAACPAWVRGHDGTGYLVQEDVGDACLHDHFARACPEPADRRPWLTRLADALAFLHLAGCFHADLKTANWIVDAARARLRIVDCDDVRFYRQLPEWACERNLRQLSETCPQNVTVRERLRFLVAYGRATGLSSRRRRELAQGPGLSFG
jgi:tRNA A-37 threonylcarbamoyl transferase component Bud32